MLCPFPPYKRNIPIVQSEKVAIIHKSFRIKGMKWAKFFLALVLLGYGCQKAENIEVLEPEEVDELDLSQLMEDPLPSPYEFIIMETGMSEDLNGY